MKTLLVFSHLRWHFVYQRPQHLLSRLASRYRVIVVEEPVHDVGVPHLEIAKVTEGLEVVRPHTWLAAPGFHDEQLAQIEPLIAAHLRSQGIADYIVWFYTPMALPLLNGLNPRAVIYDCMDELSAFLGAPAELRERERDLLARADLVLTGGPSLYEAKRSTNERVVCLPSSVDARHFAPDSGRDDELVRRAAELQPIVNGPRLGYFGVVDERMDLALLARLADEDPSWQIVIVGPVVKIDPATLPHRANLHWLGQQPYSLLPCLVDTWDVCLMPFAINEATRFISPTKTLEYMAAEKPVVSTAIRDVETLYGDVVAIALDHDEFAAACRDALAESASQRRERQAAMASAVSRFSWDRTADAVHAAIEDVMAEKAGTARRGRGRSSAGRSGVAADQSLGLAPAQHAA